MPGSVKTSGGWRGPIEIITDLQERQAWADRGANVELLRGRGFTNADEMLIGFDLTFEVVPIGSNEE